MIQHGHYEKETIRKRLDRLHELWDRLFSMLDNKGIKLQQALKLLQFMRKCDEMLYWIKDKVLNYGRVLCSYLWTQQKCLGLSNIFHSNP